MTSPGNSLSAGSHPSTPRPFSPGGDSAFRSNDAYNHIEDQKSEVLVTNARQDDGSWLTNFRKRATDTFGLWLVVYPTATIVIAIIGPYLTQLPLPMRTLVTSAIVVTLVANLTGPFGRWVVKRTLRYSRADSRSS